MNIFNETNVIRNLENKYLIVKYIKKQVLCVMYSYSIYISIIFSNYK